MSYAALVEAKSQHHDSVTGRGLLWIILWIGNVKAQQITMMAVAFHPRRIEISRGHRTVASAVHCAFDLLELDGEDLQQTTSANTNRPHDEPASLALSCLKDQPLAPIHQRLKPPLRLGIVCCLVAGVRVALLQVDQPS